MSIIYNNSIDDNGVKNAETLLEKLPNQINSTTGVLAEVNLLTENDKEYITIVVKQAKQPVSYRGKFYYRSGSTLQEMNGFALQDFLINKMGLSFDAFPNSRATIEDIDRDAIDFFLRNAVAAGRISSEVMHDTTEKILHNLNLVADDGNLTNAAVLLFAKDPQRFFIGIYIQVD